MNKILIDQPEAHEASTGEVYELNYVLMSLPLISNIQKSLIIRKINDNPIYKIKEVTANQGKLTVTIVIVDNPFPLVLAIGAITTVLAGFFIWGSLDKVYKIVESPEGKILSISTIIGAIVGLVVIITLLRK